LGQSGLDTSLVLSFFIQNARFRLFLSTLASKWKFFECLLNASLNTTPADNVNSVTSKKSALNTFIYYILHDVLLCTISNSCIFIYHFDGLESKLVFSGHCGVLALVNESVFVLLA